MKVSEMLNAFKNEHHYLIDLGMRVMGLALSEYVVPPIESPELEVHISPMFSPEDNAPMYGRIQVLVPIVFNHSELPAIWKYLDWGEYPVEFAVESLEVDEDIPSIVQRTTLEVPEEFQGTGDLPWDEGMAPWRYEALVDRCADEIRTLFRKPRMSRSELLDALAFGDFNKHSKECDEMKLKRLGIL